MAFPQTRLRRLRATRALRGLVRETSLEPADLVYPLFVAHGLDRREPIEAMPGIDRLSIGHAVTEAAEAAELGIPAVLLFGIPAHKDEEGSGAWDDEGIVQLATRAIKERLPDLTRDHRRVPVRVHRATATAACCARRHGGQRRHARASRAHRGLAGPRRRRPRRPQRHDGRPRGRDPRRRSTRAASRRRRSSPTRPSSPRPSTAPSAKPPTPRRRSATAAATRWTRPTPRRRCARRHSTSRRAPTS